MYSWLNTYEGNAAVVAGVKEAMRGWPADEGSVVIGQVVREYLDQNGLGGDQTYETAEQGAPFAEIGSRLGP